MNQVSIIPPPNSSPSTADSKVKSSRAKLQKERRSYLSRIRVWLDRWLVPTCKRSGFLASTYYLFFNRAFRREHRASLEGRYRYYQELAAPSETSALLRRNVHRLEKGLLMRPRRDVFALDFIAETVACYEQMRESDINACLSHNTELQWAHDVLTEYFAVTARDARSDGARRRFNQIATTRLQSAKLVPYRRNIELSPPVTYHQLLLLARHRRSVRWFRDAPVPRDLVDQAIVVATQSPSACNRQPFLFRIFDKPDLVRQVANLPKGTPGFAHNIPMIAVVVGQLRNFPSERDRHLVYIDGSLAAMSFILALESQGLSSCCINWPDIEDRERRMVSILGLAQDERPIMCIAIGFPDPDGLVAYSHKKPVEQLRRYN